MRIDFFLKQVHAISKFCLSLMVLQSESTLKDTVQVAEDGAASNGQCPILASKLGERLVRIYILLPLEHMNIPIQEQAKSNTHFLRRSFLHSSTDWQAVLSIRLQPTGTKNVIKET